ncbi:uncharacterized protein E5676_scaffold496G00380 [Cucumis melo var. makuwa]|uniref:DUF6737 domain-containing protein n=1 Tax=Cucumis melo var. makuwa TaxID=1194695 RepID=A0A5D3CTE0_CUCMM|nr:uncharacterized protein E6C27_scaffold280G001610 [Cucumis melo var. makuwa]TYK13419.1 uncharacterized protein E5676_scaffold496G00380 [Cucumis melo var. makuwa]
MGALSLLLATSLPSYHFPSSTQTLLSNFAASSQLLSFTPKCTKFRTKTLVFGKQSRIDNDSQFLDENGVVDDMDGYLNYHSFEYDSVWDTKPSWCQPWTITLTGLLVIASSWVAIKSVAVTAVILTLICLWWYIFLYSYPKAYSEMIAERRRKAIDEPSVLCAL